MNALGAIAAVPSYFGLLWRAKTELDDSLDVVAAHGVGGTVGALLTGVFAQKSLNGVADGLLFGHPAQLGIQAIAVCTAIVYSGIASYALLKLVALVFPLRAADADEIAGLDTSLHGEEAYVHAAGGGAMEPEQAPSAAPARELAWRTQG
jgi:ammonium transporter, Amt family